MTGKKEWGRGRCQVCGCEILPEGCCPACMLALGIKPTEAGDDYVVGVEFGDYLLVEQIACGTNGSVHRAWHRQAGRYLVLKRMHREILEDDEQIRRFRSDARAVLRLEHPNIVPIYEVGEVGGYHYYTMKFVPGGTLAEGVGRLFRDDLESRIGRVVGAIARAVHCAHLQGVNHWGLKPTKILLDESLIPRLFYRGLVGGHTDPCADGIEVSSRMSSTETPRVLRHCESWQLGVADDVRGLGGIIFFLITGEMLEFQRSSVAKERTEAEEAREAIIRLAPDCYEDLRLICLTCLHRDADLRYKNALEVAEALSRFCDSRSIVATSKRASFLRASSNR